MSSTRSQFFRFALVGVAGFAVDAAVLHIAMKYGGANPYAGRLISYLMAASFTWALNRRFTFYATRCESAPAEWARFLAGNALGGLLNYGVYASLVAGTAIVSQYPVIGVAAGSIAGLLINFILSRRFVFTGASSPREPRVNWVILVLALLTICGALTLIVNPWPRDRWYLTSYMLFGSFPGYDDYTPVSVPAFLYFGAHSLARVLGLDLAGEFYVASLMQDLMLFLSACFLYWAIRLMRMPRVAATVAIAFLIVVFLIGLPHTFYSENAVICLMSALILTFAAILHGRDLSERRFWTLAIVSGVLIGLLVVTRMTPVLLIPLMPVLFWRRLPARRITVVVGAAMVITLTLLMGLAISNHARFGRYEVTNSSGRHLWQGVKDFSDRALAGSREYQALERVKPRLQGTYWDKIPPAGPYRTVADPREPMLKRLAMQAIRNAPGLYLLHGVKKFVREIGQAPSQDLHAPAGEAWNPLRRTEPLPPLLDVMHVPPKFSAAGRALLQVGYDAFERVYPISIVVLALSGMAMASEHTHRVLSRRWAHAARPLRLLLLSVFLVAGVLLAAIPFSVFGRTRDGYIEGGLCALLVGFVTSLLADTLGKRSATASTGEDHSLFFFSALAFFGSLWFTWQVEFQAPRYALPYLPFWAMMLAIAVPYWKRAVSNHGFGRLR